MSEEKTKLEIEKLRLEIDAIKKDRSSVYSKYGELIRLLLGFTLTGLLGTYAGITFQSNIDRQKEKSTAREKTVLRCEETLKCAEDVLAQRQYYQIKMLGILESRAKGDMSTYSAIEDKLYDKYIESLNEWNINLNMNRIIIKKVFGEEVCGIFYGDGPGVQWEDTSITMKFILINKGIKSRWNKYKTDKTYSMDDLIKKHWEQADQIALFYDKCLDRIIQTNIN